MDQLFEDGKVVTVDGQDLECVGVSYQEVDGQRHNFSYTFRPKAEVDAEREAVAKAEEERLAAEAEMQQSAEEVTPPEENKEETHYVK